MISRQELIFNPGKHEPLGSVKSVYNRPNDIDFTALDINKLFTSQSNISMMTNNIYKVARQNGARSSIDQFRKLIPRLANQFMIENNLSEYETVEAATTGINNWVEVLKSINNEFMKHCYRYFKWNTFVPTREWADVGPRDNRKQKRFQDITAADAHTLDLWRTQETQRMNKHFRNDNKISVRQASMHTRHFDRHNEGLTHDDNTRASLDTPVRGYDMTNVRATLDKWKSEDWFGM